MDLNAATIAIQLDTAADTDRLGLWFSSRLRAGDCILLQGPIGAGKSQFARAFIRGRVGRSIEVPSPTFTLVQVYHADEDIWHADLYRLSHPDEAIELGLDDAFGSAITLIEWPDRLGKMVPSNAIRLWFQYSGDGRVAEVTLADRAELLAALRKDWGSDGL